MADYLEHDKLRAIADKSQAIGDFLEWTRGTLCEVHHHTKECRGRGRAPECGLSEGDFTPIRRSIVDQLAEYFDIDQQRLDDEKRAMLDELRRRDPLHNNPTIQAQRAADKASAR